MAGSLRVALMVVLFTRAVGEESCQAGTSCLEDAEVPASLSLLQVGLAVNSGEGRTMTVDRHHSAPGRTESGANYSVSHSGKVASGSDQKGTVSAGPLSEYSWQVRFTALTMWVTLLSLLIIWGPVSEAVMRVVSQAWQGSPQRPPTPIDPTTRKDRTEGGQMASPSIPHACIPPNSTLLDLLFAESPAAPPTQQHCEERVVLSAITDNRLAISGATPSSRSWSYAQLMKLVSGPSWTPLTSEACVGMALLPGPECAAALLCIFARTKCAPINVDSFRAEAVPALQRVNATVVLVSRGAAEGVTAAALELGLAVWTLPAPGEAGDFVPRRSLSLRTGSICANVEKTNESAESEAYSDAPTQERWNTAEDVALVLRTSGTTGNSKVVPLRLGQLIMGARSIAASMELRRDDVCLNAMPLFHIGGISCNLLGSLVSRGSVICLGSFNPQSFVEALGNQCHAAMHQPTWYYAVPAMHQALVNFTAGSDPQHSLRLVRSGAAALTTTLQQELRHLWNCPVFATYSMTECMPIASASPLAGGLEGSESRNGWLAPLGSVGRPIGPSVVIRDGEVLISGDVVMKGYVGPDTGLTEDGMLPTGDLGYLDSEGFLWLTGRKKEVINRGGETIPPQEVEECLFKCKWIQEAAAFAVPHPNLGEAVGLAVVLQTPNSKVEPQELMARVADIQEQLGRSHFPSIIAFLDCLPRTPAGKVQRLSIFSALQMGDGPKEANADDSRSIVLDARGASGRALRCRYLVPMPDTVVGIFCKAGETSGEALEEVEDSMGQLRTLSVRAQFETKVALQMYMLGIVGITLAHWKWYVGFPFTPAMSLLTDLLSMNTWHLQIFFAAAGYLDRDSEDFNLKDLVSVFMVVVMPFVLYPLWAGNESWWGLEHPARWFFSILLACRMFSLGLRKLGASRVTQTILVAPFAITLVCLFGSLNDMGKSDTSGNLYNFLAIFAIDQLSYLPAAPKISISIITYVIFLNAVPPVLDRLAKAGPKTRKGEMQLGIVLWCLFTVCLFSGLNTLEQSQLTVGSHLGFWPEIWKWQMHTLSAMMVAWARVALLAAALSFMPFTGIPEQATKCLLGTLVLIPLTTSQRVTSHLHLAVSWHQSSSWQLMVILAFFLIYTAVLAPLLHGACGLALRLASKFWAVLSGAK